VFFFCPLKFIYQNPGKEEACCESASGDEAKKQQGQATTVHVSEGKFHHVKLIKL